MSGSNSRIVASRCARSACCWPSCRSSWITIPASSARLLLNALMTCGSPINECSWNTIDHDSRRYVLHHKYTGGGGCYIMPRNWTDWAPPGASPSPGCESLLIDAFGLVQLAELVACLKRGDEGVDR